MVCYSFILVSSKHQQEVNDALTFKVTINLYSGYFFYNFYKTDFSPLQNAEETYVIDRMFACVLITSLCVSYRVFVVKYKNPDLDKPFSVKILFGKINRSYSNTQ